MATIRGKLTTAYTAALLGSVAVFSIALFAARGRVRTRRLSARWRCRPISRSESCATPLSIRSPIR
jgi:hypothetical protein